MIWFKNIRRLVKFKAMCTNLRRSFKALTFRIKIFALGMEIMELIVYIDTVMRFLYQQLPSLKDKEVIETRNKNIIVVANDS